MSSRTYIKRGVKRLIMGLRARGKAADRAVILRYHSVKRDPSKHAATIGTGIIQSEADFAAQMNLLKTRYTPVTLDDIAHFINSGKPLAPRAVAVTFDDGFADNYEIAAPILDDCGIKAAFYITTDHIGNATVPWFIRLRYAFAAPTAPRWSHASLSKSFNLAEDGERNEAFLEACRQCAKLVGVGQLDFLAKVEEELGRSKQDAAALMMDWSQVRDLVDRGHIVGSHTCSHPNLAHIPKSEAYEEIKHAREMVEEKGAGEALHFSYPSPILEPHYSDETVAITRELGFLTAVTCTRGSVGKGDEPLSLKRIWVPAHPVDFSWEIEKAFSGR